jgi:hypothetical protein
VTAGGAPVRDTTQKADRAGLPAHMGAGERIATAGGNSRLTDAYFERRRRKP